MRITDLNVAFIISVKITRKYNYYFFIWQGYIVILFTYTNEI